ncbi:hypothetical protein GA0111570_103276 [Raineyella antarctica]|uniref:Pirin N-terminal domain-containing protein n=1 Tax=Raineyella antarctica TaxID=1577474 RepID=A0A1G6GHU0_9ACTN|nr:pirin family protein [Raineyella antarctica]SDB81413.1 hypothetical protein GA0111570_103276 [Raineyella antarctica]
MELFDARTANLGSFEVRRILPQRHGSLRTVGAWCFADHMGPALVTEEHGIDVAPHPHMGLQTATWLLDGQILHKDSLGSEQVIAPGQLNLMTAGRGISHSEEATGHYAGTLEGIQLWIAQPDATRDGDQDFAHHADLPVVDLDGGAATVITGEFLGRTSPARRDTDLVGLELDLQRQTTLPLRPDYEYALIVLRGRAGADGESLTPGHLGYLAPGRDELGISVDELSRAILLGGVPFDSPVQMAWNFVGRTREEMDEATEIWNDPERRAERFGHVSSALPPTPAPPTPWNRWPTGA